MTINLHIDRILLDGIDLSQQQLPELQVAIESELVRLLETKGIAHSGGSRPHIISNPIQLPNAPQPAQLGQQIATAAYEGIHQP